MACQVRTSYIANEILWGHRFKPSTIGSKINICNLTTDFIDLNNEPEKITRNTVLRRFEYDYNMFHVHYAVIKINLMALKKLYIDRATNVGKKRRRQRL